jgi:hypothetical protein
MYPLRFGWSALRSARDARFKFIDAPRPELYDTDADPAERRNLVDVRPAVARALAATLAVAPASAAESPLDDAARARLASLGYISGSSSTQSPRPPAAPDPKDHVDDYNEKMRRSACHPACEEQQ